MNTKGRFNEETAFLLAKWEGTYFTICIL
jgi:hypothetical protein